MVSEPVKYLSDYAVTEELCPAQLWLAEEYLIKVWAGAYRKVAAHTFDSLPFHLPPRHGSPCPPVGLLVGPPSFLGPYGAAIRRGR